MQIFIQSLRRDVGNEINDKSWELTIVFSFKMEATTKQSQLESMQSFYSDDGVSLLFIGAFITISHYRSRVL